MERRERAKKFARALALQALADAYDEISARKGDLLYTTRKAGKKGESAVTISCYVGGRIVVRRDSRVVAISKPGDPLALADDFQPGAAPGVPDDADR
jgi:hypothetical protein